MSEADILNKAADLIEPEGAWTQGAFSRNPDGSADIDEDGLAATNPVCWCALGAIAQAAECDPLDLRTFGPGSPLESAEAERFLKGILHEPVELFNDAPERTQAEVVAKLREAAMLAARSTQGDQP